MPLFFAAICTLVALMAGSAAAQQTPPSPGGAECGPDNLLAGKAPAQSVGMEGNPALVTDGTIAQEGAQWDAPAAVTFENTNATLTFDLGTARSVGAFFLQGDANDTYRVMGSVDGTEGSYRLLAEFDNVVGSGHGLRNRAVETTPSTVRYLRVSAGSGDNNYSISEFAAYCRTPSPFPPTLRTVEAPLAQRVAPPKESIEPPEGGARGGFAFLFAAAALALVGWGYDSARKRSTGRAGTAAAGGRPSAESDTEVARRSLDDRLRLMFLASGCAALIYEVVWFHLLRLVIGASALSVGIVLASFMGGMFLGSLLFARFVSQERRPLRVYALLEIGIGVFGLLMPLILPAARFVYVGLVGYGPLGIVLRGLVAVVLLLPPTTLMGATLPAIARRYTHGRRGMSGLASLYSANTVGAVLGSLISAFWLLAYWDVWITTLVAVALNFAVGGYAWRLGATTPVEPVPAPVTTPVSAGVRPNQLRPVYLAAALSGLTALGAQVVWTRLLTLLFGATVFAFAIILAVFLAGLGIGSAVAAYLLRRGRNPLRSLAFSQLALVPLLLLSAYVLARVLPYSSPAEATPVRALHALHVLRAIDVVLPCAVLWGMSFPFALAAGAGHSDPAHSSGRIYAANTIGAIVGALGISFVAIPVWGTRGAEQCLVVCASVSAAVLFYALRRASAAPVPQSSAPEKPFGVVPAALVLALGVGAAGILPGLPRAFQAHGRYIWWLDPADRYLYVREGAASTVAVHLAPDGYRHFHVSGRVEASSNPADMRMERLLGHLSALAHPRPERVLVVGLGAGVTAGALSLYPEIQRIVICEIEPRVVGAAEQFRPENYGVLSDPRVELVFDDARHFLATTSEKFDIITSDPIHPWVRGNSVLFSREYYDIVRSHLLPGGLASQWVPLYETTELAIQIQMRTFTEAFPDGTVWNSAGGTKGYDVVLLGSAEPLKLDLLSMQSRIDKNPRILESLRQVRLTSALDILATYGTNGRDMRGWLADTPVNRDFSLKLEYISGLGLNDKQANLIYAHMTAGRVYPETLFAGHPELQNELRRRILPASGNAKR